jgi:predicted O-methyltransferase YrrM
MTTLTQPPLSPLLDRLFAEAEASEDALKQEMESLSTEQRTANRADYREFYARLKDHPLPVSRASAKLLYMLARARVTWSPLTPGSALQFATIPQ